MIPYSTQCIDSSDIDAVVRALGRDCITQGSLVDDFERSIAEYLGVKFVVVVNSGTSALNLAYKAVQVGKCYAITTPISFCATTNMLLENNISPIFCDCGIDGNINIDCIKEILNMHPHRDSIKMLVTVDFAGNSVNVDEVLKICHDYNIYFISDSSHSFGGSYNGCKIGQFADITVFSFHALKPMTTIEGGAVATNNERFYNIVKSLRSHGIKKNDFWDSDLYYIGHNFRLSDVSCALGMSQLQKLDLFINKRSNIARYYDKRFKSNSYFDVLEINNNVRSTYHLYPIFLKPYLWEHKNSILSSLFNIGIGVQVHYKPIYHFNLYKNYHSPLSSAEKFYRSEISIPCHQKMTMEDVEFVANNLLDVLSDF